MSRLMARYYDRFMRASERSGLSAWRTELLRDVQGEVLEVGAGTGVNLGLYPADAPITRLVLSEPDRHMRALLEQKLSGAAPGFPVEVNDASLEALPFQDASFDAVVAMLVLCSVRDPVRSLEEARRVLRPGGRLVFLEHVAAEGRPGRLLLQRCVQPLWRVVAGNCHLTRPTASLIERAGFRTERLEEGPLPKAPAFVRPTVRGIATRP